MSEAYAKNIEAALRADGKLVTTAYVPAPDDTVDDSIEFLDDSRTARYPFAIQVSQSYCSVVTEHYDADGHLEAVTHGPVRRPDDMLGLAGDVLDALERLSPVPLADRKPPGAVLH